MELETREPMPRGFGLGGFGGLFHHEKPSKPRHHWNPFHHHKEDTLTSDPESESQNSANQPPSTNGKRSLGDLKEREWDSELQERSYNGLDELD